MWKALGWSLALILGVSTAAVAQDITGVETKRVKTLQVRPDGTIVGEPTKMEGIIKSPHWLIVCSSPDLLKLLVNRQLSGDKEHQEGCWKLCEGQKISVTYDYGDIVYAMTQTYDDPTMDWNPMWTFKHWLFGSTSLRVPRNKLHLKSRAHEAGPTNRYARRHKARVSLLRSRAVGEEDVAPPAPPHNLSSFAAFP